MRITISANDLQWKETPLINAVIKQVIKLGNFQFRKQMNRSKKYEMRKSVLTQDWNWGVQLGRPRHET